MLENVVLIVLPRLVKAVIMAMPMRAAMRPYSMAVAPDSHFANAEMDFMMLISKLVLTNDADYSFHIM